MNFPKIKLRAPKQPEVLCILFMSQLIILKKADYLIPYPPIKQYTGHVSSSVILSIWYSFNDRSFLETRRQNLCIFLNRKKFGSRFEKVPGQGQWWIAGKYMKSRLQVFGRIPVGLGRKAVVEMQANDPN